MKIYLGQGKIYTPLAVLLKLRRISYTGSRLSWLTVGLKSLPKRASIKHSLREPCVSEANAKWNQKAYQ